VIVKSKASDLVELCIHLWLDLLLVTRNFVFPESWFSRCVTAMGQKKRRPCVNSPKNFCYICGQFMLKSEFVANTCSEVNLILQFWMSCGRLRRNLGTTIMSHYVLR